MTNMERVQKGGFLLLGFLLGSVGPLWDSLFNGLLIALTFLAFLGSRSAREGWKAGKVYIGANVAFLLYFALHTTVVVGGGRMEGNPTYSLFEALLLGFVLIPVYVSALREWMTPRLLRAFLAVFCAGNVCLQCYVCYDMIGFWFLTDLKSALKVLIFTRFGDNREVLGSVYLIEMRAMGMAVAALFAYFFAFRAGRWWKRMVFGGMFLLSLAFLVFTVTKSALLGFAMGFALLNVYLFRLSHWRTRVGMVVLVAVLVAGSAVSVKRVEKFGQRVEEVKQDLRNMREGNYDGRTIGPRIAIFKAIFDHVDEFALWGEGVYSKERIHKWFAEAEDEITVYFSSQNAFLQYWIQGGLFGLALVVYLFVAPVARNWRRSGFPWLVVSVTAVFFVVSNTCVTLSKMNGRPLILFFLALFYFYGGMFVRLSEEREEKKQEIKRFPAD